MVNLTLSVPRQLKEDMDNFKEINWSEVARSAIKNKILLLKKFQEFAKNSELKEKDALTLGKELNKSLAKRYKR